MHRSTTGGAYKQGVKDERERIINGLEEVSESIRRCDGVYANELLDFIESLRNVGKSECWQCGVVEGYHACPKCGAFGPGAFGPVGSPLQKKSR